MSAPIYDAILIGCASVLNTHLAHMSAEGYTLHSISAGGGEEGGVWVVMEKPADNPLAAAAPELLQKLEWILTDMTFAAPETFYERCQRWAEAAQIAVSKAKGESR